MSNKKKWLQKLMIQTNANGSVASDNSLVLPKTGTGTHSGMEVIEFGKGMVKDDKKKDTKPIPKCHVGTPKVFVDPATGQPWYAGGSSRGFKAPDESVVVALTEGVIDTKILANIPMVPLQDPTVFIRWSDGSAAPLKTLNDWKGLLRALRATNLPVAAACMGGHGRTGTFLAIMSWLMELPQKEGKRPVQYIRDIYCVEAVESKVQFEQIKTITGEDETKLFVPTAFEYYGGGGFYGGKFGSSGWDYAAGCDPVKENDLLGWFWGQMPGAKSMSKYQGFPTSTGKWEKDSSGWYWAWDGVEKPLYIPIENVTPKPKHKTQGKTEEKGIEKVSKQEPVTSANSDDGGEGLYDSAPGNQGTYLNDYHNDAW